MRSFIIFLCLSCSLVLGQVTPILTVPSGPITPGQTAVISVSISSTAGSSPAGVEWTTTYNATVFTGSPTWSIGASAATAGKSLNCRVSAPGSLICIIDGPNTTITIADGVIATISLPLSITAVPGTTPLGLTTASAADITGTGITVASPANATITIAALPCDLDATGTVTQLDVTAARNQALGAVACTTGDLNGDKVCNVIDIQRFQIAASGGACRTGA